MWLWWLALIVSSIEFFMRAEQIEEYVEHGFRWGRQRPLATPPLTRRYVVLAYRLLALALGLVGVVMLIRTLS